jgi:hypothetical protein
MVTSAGWSSAWRCQWRGGEACSRATRRGSTYLKAGEDARLHASAAKGTPVLMPCTAAILGRSARTGRQRTNRRYMAGGRPARGSATRGRGGRPYASVRARPREGASVLDAEGGTAQARHARGRGERACAQNCFNLGQSNGDFNAVSIFINSGTTSPKI